MKKYWVSVGLNVSVDYGLDDDYIEAEDKEEAMEIAKQKAMEDIEINNASFTEDDIRIYAIKEIDEVKGTEEE